jgi:FkbM family methyltransferase
MICDVGSNIGASLLQMLTARPRARAVAVEPSDRFRPLLRRNLELAGVRQVDILPVILGATAGQTWLYNNTTTASAVRAVYDGHEPRGRQQTRMTTLDEVWRDRARMDFLKIDTDGMDFAVLHGAEDILRRQRPVLFFELEAHLLKQPIEDLAWLHGLGYRRLICFKPGGELIGTTTDPTEAVHWASTSGYCDMLALADDPANDTRIAGLLARLRAQPMEPSSSGG